MDEPVALGGRARTHAAGQDQLARTRLADRAHEARRAADVGHDAERDLGQAQHAVLARDADVRGERELERHADAHAVERGDHRLVQPGDPMKHVLQLMVKVEERRLRVAPNTSASSV